MFLEALEAETMAVDVLGGALALGVSAVRTRTSTSRRGTSRAIPPLYTRCDLLYIS